MYKIELTFATMLQVTNKYINNKADHYGVIVSLMCAVHCAILPLLLSFGFLEGIHWANHMLVDISFLIVSLYIAFYSLLRSYKNSHTSFIPLSLAAIGFSLFAYCLFTHSHEQIIFPVLAGLTIAFAHYYNHRLVHHATLISTGK